MKLSTPVNAPHSMAEQHWRFFSLLFKPSCAASPSCRRVLFATFPLWLASSLTSSSWSARWLTLQCYLYLYWHRYMNQQRCRFRVYLCQLLSCVCPLFRIPANLTSTTTCLSLCASPSGSPARLTLTQSAALRRLSSLSSLRSFRMMFRVCHFAYKLTFLYANVLIPGPGSW